LDFITHYRGVPLTRKYDLAKFPFRAYPSPGEFLISKHRIDAVSHVVHDLDTLQTHVYLTRLSRERQTELREMFSDWHYDPSEQNKEELEAQLTQDAKDAELRKFVHPAFLGGIPRPPYLFSHLKNNDPEENLPPVQP
jgi:hypothetical protein